MGGEGKHVREPNRTEHMLEVEGSAVKRKIYICEYFNCGEMFPRPMLLADHERKAHGAAKLKCQNQECSATFDSRQSQLRQMSKEGSGPPLFGRPPQISSWSS